MEYTPVKSGETKVLAWGEASPALATFNLGNEFAIAAFNVATKTAGLTRNTDKKTLNHFLNSLLPSDNLLLRPVLEIRIMGGDADMASENQLKEILMLISTFDAGRDLIRIASADVCGKPCPHSFKIRCSDGLVEAIDSV